MFKVLGCSDTFSFGLNYYYSLILGQVLVQGRVKL